MKKANQIMTLIWKDVIWKFTLCVFLISYIWQYIIYLTGGTESVLFPFVMFFPGLIAILFRIIFKEGFRNVGWGLRRWWYIIPALIVPIVVVIIFALVVNATGIGSISDKHFTISTVGIEVKGYRLILGIHQQTYLFFIVNFLFTLLIQSVLGGILTLGEEFGWRGYLQEKILKRYGLNKGIILVGIIWGYWHLPIILMGYNFPTCPILGALVFMPLGCIFMGIFLGWIYLRSKSIWMPVIAHSSINLMAALLINEVTMMVDLLYQQILFIGIWGVVAAICLFLINRRKPVLWQIAEEKYI
jgi:membrane protease YdiL (CAAX protease family)